MKELEYPFDSEKIIKKKKSLRRNLLSNADEFLKINIAILGGVTTRDILQVLELFLLNYGIKPAFYESEYNKYYEDGIFYNQKLKEFNPDIIYICTSIRNIREFPILQDDHAAVVSKRETIIRKFEKLWDSLDQRYRCPIIQNNFEYPYFRLLGNMDSYDIHGRVNFVTELNRAFYEYARRRPNLYICDINYLSASYGLDNWSDPSYWHMYKYAVAVPAIPYLSYNVANIIKSIYGKNKKVFNLDLDNTLWGGIIGDVGVENIEIGHEDAIAETYTEFQEYIKLHKGLGIILTVNSKNEIENAESGFKRPDSVLKMDDFASFKANWNPKYQNLIETADELNLLPESFVFIDDNPAERGMIQSRFPSVGTPEIYSPEHYISVIDKSGFFEMTSLSEDDIERTRMYQENAKRTAIQSQFKSHDDYLRSLEMHAEIQSFIPEYMSRIAQLTNKSNQFNLTTKRYSQSEIESIAADKRFITLYGKLEDKFGDNGVVSVIICAIKGINHDEAHIQLWLMSCRVLKRSMEFAMMDSLINKCKSIGIKSIYGYYYPTKKNGMVKDFYQLQGFEKIFEDGDGTTWKYELTDDYQNKQNVIKVDM